MIKAFWKNILLKFLPRHSHPSLFVILKSHLAMPSLKGILQSFIFQFLVFCLSLCRSRALLSIFLLPFFSELTSLIHKPTFHGFLLLCHCSVLRCQLCLKFTSSLTNQFQTFTLFSHPVQLQAGLPLPSARLAFQIPLHHDHQEKLGKVCKCWAANCSDRLPHIEEQFLQAEVGFQFCVCWCSCTDTRFIAPKILLVHVKKWQTWHFHILQWHSFLRENQPFKSG